MIRSIVIGAAFAILAGAAAAQEAGAGAAPGAADVTVGPPGDAAAGEAIFKRCAGCHAVGEGARHKVGPHLNNVFGRVAGSLEDYNYSAAMKEAGQNGVVWTEETLSPFIEAPRVYIKGTKMAFPGLKDPQQRADVIAYLRTFSPDYVPATGAADPEAAGAAAPANPSAQ